MCFIIFTAGTRTALWLWKEESATILQLLHMGFGVGALTGPLLCSPFLAVVGSKTSDQNQGSQFTVIKESRADIAFTIIGLFTICVALPFYIFHCTKGKTLVRDRTESQPISPGPVSKSSSYWSFINPATYANGNFTFGLYVFAFLSVYYFNIVGGEKLYGSFVRTIAVDVYKLEKTNASYLNSMFWVSLTVGRLVGSIVSRHMPVQKLILLQNVAHFCSVTAIYLYALRSVQLFWCLTILEGFAIAPLYPLGIAFGDSQIHLSGFCLMIVTFSGSVGDMTYLWAGGRMYDVYGPGAVLPLTSLAGFAMALAVVIFRRVSRQSTHDLNTKQI